MGIPEYYLGGDVEIVEYQVTTKDVVGIDEAGNDENNKSLGVQWLKEGIKTAFSAKTYIQNTTKRLEAMIGKESAKFDTPMSETSHPELDDSLLLDNLDHSKFRSIVGIANWLVTLGRFDIAYAVNSLYRFSAKPRQGHLKGITRFLGYLKKNWKGRIMIDPNYPNHSNYPIPEHDNWKEFYPDAKEDISTGKDRPTPKGPMDEIHFVEGCRPCTLYVDKKISARNHHIPEQHTSELGHQEIKYREDINKLIRVGCCKKSSRSTPRLQVHVKNDGSAGGRNSADVGRQQECDLEYNHANFSTEEKALCIELSQSERVLCIISLFCSR